MEPTPAFLDMAPNGSDGGVAGIGGGAGEHEAVSVVSPIQPQTATPLVHVRPEVQVHIQRAEAAPVVVSESGVVSVGAGIKRCITDIWAPRAVVLVGALVLMLALVLHLALPNSHASRSTVAALVLVACVLFAGYCVYHQCFSEETDGGDATYHTELTAEGERV